MKEADKLNVDRGDSKNSWLGLWQEIREIYDHLWARFLWQQ